MGDNGFSDREAGQIEQRLDDHEEKLDEIIERIEDTHGELSEEVRQNSFFRKIGYWVGGSVMLPLLLSIAGLLLRDIL